MSFFRSSDPSLMRTSIFFWLLLVAVYTNILSGHWTFVSAQCLTHQQSLLLSLKNGLVFNASLSTKLAEWNPGSNNWPGVTCENGQVTGLDLGNESISDGINGTSSLFSLQHLKRLNLAFNMLSSKEIPPQIGNLSSLEYLNLSNTGLAGQIPVQMSNLTRLTTLDLSSVFYFPGSNSLKLENPDLKTLIAGLDQLRELYLDGVNVSAPGREWCEALSTSLSKLQVLSMSNCYLSGPIDSSLVNLKSLSVIRLGNNNLSAVVPNFFAHFTNLTILHMSSAGLLGIFPQEIFQVSTLKNLALSNNPLLQGSFPEFPMGSYLQTVAVSFTNFSEQLPHSIGNLRNLSRMELMNCSFSGQIPNSMGDLSQLVYLDFSFNNFSGLVPSFSNFTNMTTLILSHNSLTGEINSTLWECLQKLEIVDLRYNLLDGSISLSLFALPRIEKVQLSNNRFSGSVQLEESLNFSSYVLDTVDLGNNDLSGQIPTALFRYPELKYLSLSCNTFNGSMDINEVQKVSSLTYLDLSYNNLSVLASGAASANSSFPQLSTVKLASCHLKTLPGFLSNQSKLINLDLSDNEMDGVIPNWIWSLELLLYLNLSWNSFDLMESQNLSSSLGVLDLHSNKLRGKLPPVPLFASYVDYSRNQFSSVIPDNIGSNLSVTVFFSLSHNNFQGTIPESICQAGYLQGLDLSDNALEGIIPPCIVNMTFLKVLNLRNNNLNGSVPEGYPKACNLRTLDLSENSLQGKIPQTLSNCTRLEVLDVGGNQMDGGFPCQLKNRTFIRVLVMRRNKFSGQIGCPHIHGAWDTLQIVDLASNRFDRLPPTQALSTWKAMQDNDDHDHLQSSFLGLTGLYYQDTVTVTVKGLTLELVKILKVFTSIDISDNIISGEIPSIMGTFQSLLLLNMSRNKISGQIPPSFGNLTNLESMDLSRNQLKGPIPSELVNLSFLSVLNLSYNQLAGSIPMGRQFDTFESNSYLNNRGLCGTPLNLKCSSNGGSANPTAPVPKSRGVVHLDCQLIVTGFGFGTGAAVAVAQLTMWTAFRKWYDERIDKLLLVFLPMLGFTYTIWDDEESEGGGEDRSPDESQFDLEEEETWGRYCVFCSKLDQSLKKVIHDLNCTCYDSPYNSSSSVSSSYSSSSSSS